MFSASTCASSIRNLCNICSGGSLSPLHWVVLFKTSIFTGVPTCIKGFFVLNDVRYWHRSVIFSIIGEVVEGSGLMFFQDHQVPICYFEWKYTTPQSIKHFFSSFFFPSLGYFTSFLHFLVDSFAGILSSISASCRVRLPS